MIDVEEEIAIAIEKLKVAPIGSDAAIDISYEIVRLCKLANDRARSDGEI